MSERYVEQAWTYAADIDGIILLIALIVEHSGYWALLLPSCLALVLMLAATAPARGNTVRSAAQGGSH